MSKREIARELHKPARKNYTRRVVNVYGKNDLFQADLVEMIPYSRLNKGYKYILCVIDCFTKFAWSVPLKSKTAVEVSDALSKILVDRSPKLLQLDNGKEFYNQTFDDLMKKYKIKKYSTFSTTKACIIERFNRTLKTNMYREFTARGSHEWISILPMLMNNYNNSKHRTINMTPVQADANPSLVKLIRRRQRRRDITTRKTKFKVGDHVRISAHKGVFARGYIPNWSAEIFTVNKVNETSPTTYNLIDYQKTAIMGCFYSEEIQKTQYPEDYLVEKIISKKGNQILVRWVGFDKAHDSWINMNNLKQ